MRNCEIKVIKNSKDDFRLVFMIDGEIKKELEEYCFENVLIDDYDFFQKCAEEFSVDTRFDKFSINISQSYF